MRVRPSLFVLLSPLVAVLACSTGTAAPQPDHTSAGAALRPELPCDVEAALASKCQSCHSSPPVNDATVALVTYENTQGVYGNESVWKLIGEALENEAMPFEPPYLSDDERTTLLDWSHAGGPPRPLGSACP
jgi:uncharacterized membrane protein